MMKSMRHLRCLSWLALVAAPVAASAAPLPVKNAVRRPQFETVSISPRGTYIAATIIPDKHPERNVLAFFKVAALLKGDGKMLSNFTLDNYQSFSELHWASDRRIVFGSLEPVGGYDFPRLTGALYAIDADGSEFVKLMPWKNEYFFDGVLSDLPKRPNFVLVQALTRGFPQAYLIDTRGSRISDAHGKDAYHYKRAQSPGNWGMGADNDGKVRVAFGANTLTGKPEYFYRPAGSAKWRNDSGAVPRHVNTHGLGLPAFEGFTPDNRKIYLAQYVDNKNQTRGLYVFDPATKTEKLLYDNPTVDAGGSGTSDYGALIYSYDGSKLVGLRIMPGKVETLALDPRSPRMRDLAALAHVFPKQQVRITSATLDGSKAIVKVWSDTDPGAFYLFSHKPKPSLTLLFRAEPWIKPESLSPMRPITFKARDGVTLHGYLTLPRDTDGKNLPMVVIVHGGPYGIRDQWTYDPEVQLFASRGYAVLQVNYRGSGGYGNRFLSLGIRHWGDTMQDDVADGVHWAIKRGVADPRRICIFGISYGGYSALMSAERFPDLYHCAIGYSGVYDLFVIKSRKSDTGRSAYGRFYEQQILGSSKARLKKFSPVYQVASLKAPVLLMHGGEDARAPVEGYDEMVDAIKKHGTPLQTLYYPREGHGFYKVSHRAEAYEKVLAFVQKYIGPGVTH